MHSKGKLTCIGQTLEKGGAKKLVTFATHSCDIENEKSIGDFCGELQRVFF